MIHSLDTDIADKVGVHAALIFNKILDWCKYHKERNEFFFDGHFWMYNSRSSWAANFSYMSDKNIRTALDKLVDAGLIIKGNYSENKLNRTNWYALADESPLTSSGQSNSPKTANPLAASGQSIGPQRPNITIYTRQNNTSTIESKKNSACAHTREGVVADIIENNTAWVENQIKAGIEPDDIRALLDYAYDHLVNMGEQPTRQSLMRCAHYKLREFNEHKRRQSLKAVPMDERRMQFWEQSQRYSSQFSKELRDAFVLHYTQASGEDPSLMVYEQWPNFDMLSQLKKWQIKNERKTAI